MMVPIQLLAPNQLNLLGHGIYTLLVDLTDVLILEPINIAMVGEVDIDSMPHFLTEEGFIFL